MSAGMMTRACRAPMAAVVGVTCLLTSDAYAQSWQQYDLWSNTTIVGGRHLGGTPLRVEPDGTARLFVQPYQVYRDDMREVQIAFSLANTGEDALYFNSGLIERAIRVRLFSIGEPPRELLERPVTLSMRGILEKDGSGPFITVAEQSVLAEGHNGGDGRRSMVVWIAAATRPDGQPFDPGRYRFEIELHDIRSAVLTANGDPLPEAALQPWSGVRRGYLELIVTRPSTPAERAAMYVQLGDVAFERREFDEAVTLFRQAVDADVLDGTPLQRLGGTYLAMARYAEALPVLKQLPLRAQGLVEAMLAEAYVGVGNDAEAMTLLRRGGWPDAQVAARIEDLRARVQSRPRR